MQRVGRKKEALFRVVLMEHSYAAKSGKAHEILGWYDPRFNKSEIKADRVKHWISNGAKPSDSMHNLLINKGIITGKKINVLPRKSPPKKEGEAAVAQAPVSSTEEKKEVAPEPVVETPAESPAESPVEASADSSSGGDSSSSE